MIAIRSAPTSVPRAPSAPRARGSPGRATTRANASARRRAVVVPPSASSSRSVAAASASASTATASAPYALRPDAVPSTQRASCSSAAPPELVLYRDTNAWCPFCERVWLALEAKGVSYTCEFVDLRRVHVSLSFRFSPVARGQRSIASPFN
jgi:glutathione S-transferase